MTIEHVLNEMEIDADPFALCELQGRCDLGMGRRTGATLHYVLAGAGEIVFPNRPPVAVGPGTLVLVPALQPHTLRSFGAPGQPVPECRPAGAGLVHHLHHGAAGGDGAADGGALLAICSHVRVGLRSVGDLIDLVREPMAEHVAAGSPMAGALAALLAELSSPAPGGRAMVRALLLQCMIHLLRKRLQAQDRALGWMAALTDPRLWAALRRMLDAPGAAHSLESLAEAAGMSRSLFAQRFSAAYGSGPMELLRYLRMQHAAALLERSDLPVKRVAELVGFRSRSAFTRTFESIIGQPPRDFRHEALSR